MQPPVIPKLPESDLWSEAPKTIPLHTRLLMLFDFIFLMIAPNCGSVLLGELSLISSYMFCLSRVAGKMINMLNRN